MEMKKKAVHARNVILYESELATFMFDVFGHDKGHLFLHVLGRVLCLSWHLSDNTLVTGASDSTVRLYNVTSGMHLLMLPITKLFI